METANLPLTIGASPGERTALSDKPSTIKEGTEVGRTVLAKESGGL